MPNKEEIEKAKEKTKQWIYNMRTGRRVNIIHKGDKDFCNDLETLLQYIDQLEQENKQLKISYKLMENEAMKDGLEERKKLNKMIDEMAKQLYKLQYMSDPTKDCFISREYSDINDCVKKASCQDCIKQYFEKKVNESNG